MLPVDTRQEPQDQSIAQSPITITNRHSSIINVFQRPLDLLQGTLDLLILRTLALSAMHGWGISQRIQQMSDEVLRVNQGSLYPALHRLETAGWINSEWGASENNRQAKFYQPHPHRAEAAEGGNRVLGADDRGGGEGAEADRRGSDGSGFEVCAGFFTCERF